MEWFDALTFGGVLFRTLTVFTLLYYVRRIDATLRRMEREP